METCTQKYINLDEKKYQEQKTSLSAKARGFLLFAWKVLHMQNFEMGSIFWDIIQNPFLCSVFIKQQLRSAQVVFELVVILRNQNLASKCIGIHFWIQLFSPDLLYC